MRKLPLYPHGRPEPETVREFHRRLVDLLLEGHAAHMNVAEWLSWAVTEAHGRLPGGIEELLENRPGSWEAEHVRTLAGQPTYIEQMHEEGSLRIEGL